MADQADIHKLYQASVQSVETEVEFIDSVFKSLRSRPAVVLREDFCGTAAMACEWIRHRDENRAIGVDFEPSVLEWGRTHNLSALTEEQAARIQLVEADVRNAETDPADVIAAFNYSYWSFKTRKETKAYFERCREALVDDGLLILDAFGGFEAFRLLEEETENDGFTYVWDQAHYDPVTGDFMAHIHFDFPDGTRLEKAFTYDWRLWTIPEIRELLEEAGFPKTTVYWDFEDDDDEDEDDESIAETVGDTTYRQTEHGEPDAGFIAYIVAEKNLVETGTVNKDVEAEP